nr:MAG TPA: hypothetical protein [Caudoviricetes sp.]
MSKYSFFLYFLLYAVQSKDCGKFLLPITSLSCFFSCTTNSLSLLALLHCQCAICRLLISLGCPPLLMGTI